MVEAPRPNAHRALVQHGGSGRFDLGCCASAVSRRQVSSRAQQPASINALSSPLIVFAFTYFSLNSWLIAFAVAFEGAISRIRSGDRHFLLAVVKLFRRRVGGAAARRLHKQCGCPVHRRHRSSAVRLYLTFKTTMGRVEDATNHVQQLNRLSVNHRNSRHGDRRKGPNHPWPHPSRSAARCSSGQRTWRNG